MIQPIPVVIGQRIDLLARPAGSGVSEPWKVQGLTIANYTMPTAPCSGAPCKPARVAKTTKETFSDRDGTTFYWVTPGTYNVTYTYTRSDGTPVSIGATFAVDGPVATAGTVTTTPPYPATNPVLIEPYIKLPHNKGLPGIVFGTPRPSTPIPGPGIQFTRHSIKGVLASGYFFWLQVVEDSSVTSYTNKEPDRHSELQYRLDNTLPYAYTCYGINSRDSPLHTMPSNEAEFEKHFSAWMYLMWRGGAAVGMPDPDTVPIPLGAVPWVVDADVVQKNGVLTAKSGDPVTAGKGGPTTNFVPITSFPDPVDAFPVWEIVDVGSLVVEKSDLCK